MWAIHTKIYTKILIIEEKNLNLVYLKLCELCVVAYAWNPRVEAGGSGGFPSFLILSHSKETNK